MKPDEVYMQRCLELASNGLGKVAPNPMVGALIVHEGNIIGEGFHQQYGKAHAEVNAIMDAVSNHGEDILKHTILYVNLEPCVHFGKTPPCTDLIISQKIPKVVIGTIDPFAKINGAGIAKLENAGVEVIKNVAEKNCLELNKRFFTFHSKQRPYIILKFAVSADGFIAPEKMNAENKWISNELSRQLVHKWRSEEQAIMVGTNTVRIDNPSLTVRNWPGKNPLRITIDRELKLDSAFHLFDNSAPTLVFNNVKNEVKKNIEWVKIDFQKPVLQQVLDSLYGKNIQSVLIEGGAQLLQSFISENLWDEARIFTGHQTFGSGIKAPVIHGTMISEIRIACDRLRIMRKE
ncbi:MAG: bifunctional diaminohydroxyphosphoribosylaminopyrimidine deaminase/5-amino-6-(5-phosphoribosylamino)uracil reductase RibD [Bacteroidetes bacterium]|nr:bifunctional diaminohydroxyphosphoribosylaminopyrimidine deaminase/5-amino-6-(5-phosphoribosylamino)uracil reductase RibD [Bacteroidota bacterium]